MKINLIPSVNFHLWEPCNMRCKFCFATFQDVKQSILPSGHLSREQAVDVVLQLANAGFEKITFAGGEPTLCPWLPELIKAAKQAGQTTMIVTNGSRLDNHFLEQNKNYLDWITISIDSQYPETNIKMGRAVSGKKPLHVEYYKSLVEKVKKSGYGLKINTVVNSKNHLEDLNEFVRFAKPERWKILQVLPIQGQNDEWINEMAVTDEQFDNFVARHKSSSIYTTFIPESNSVMKGSYVMVDPAGRFFDNSQGVHCYSEPILEVGIEYALKEVEYDIQKFESRGGVYDWSLKRYSFPKRITISGEVASGKSTIGKMLAEKLNFTFISMGNRIREIAESRGLSIVEFQKVCKNNPKLDNYFDRKFSAECNQLEHVIIDYRLGFHFIENGYHIFLKVGEEEAVKRLKFAKRKNETFHTLKERNESFQNQFKNAYKVDFCNEGHYDFVLQTEEFESIESIVDSIIDQLRK